MQRLAGRFLLSGQFGQQHRRDGRVLVAGIRADEIAVRLFAAENEVLRPFVVDRAADVFEADLQVALGPRAERIGNAANHFAGDQGLDDIVLRAELARRLAPLEQIFRKQRADLVAGHGQPRAAGLRR